MTLVVKFSGCPENMENDEVQSYWVKKKYNEELKTKHCPENIRMFYFYMMMSFSRPLVHYFLYWFLSCWILWYNSSALQSTLHKVTWFAIQLFPNFNFYDLRNDSALKSCVEEEKRAWYSGDAIFWLNARTKSSFLCWCFNGCHFL